MMSEQTIVVAVYLCILPIMLVGSGFAFIAPEKAVRLWARYYRWIYRDVRGMSDAQIQSVNGLFPAQLLFCDLLEFINEGEKSPEKFEGMIALVRVIGGMLLFVSSVIAVIFVLAMSYKIVLALA